jgi:hypothetical protein
MPNDEVIITNPKPKRQSVPVKSEPVKKDKPKK